MMDKLYGVYVHKVEQELHNHKVQSLIPESGYQLWDCSLANPFDTSSGSVFTNHSQERS